MYSTEGVCDCPPLRKSHCQRLATGATLEPIAMTTSTFIHEHTHGIYSNADTPASRNGAEWCVNVADRWLFNCGEGNLLAQDELQIAEHPVSSCLRHAMADSTIEPLTRDRSKHDAPRPLLTRGILLHVHLDTTTGLYGNAFAYLHMHHPMMSSQPAHLASRQP
jgi:hypothetical protein